MDCKHFDTILKKSRFTKLSKAEHKRLENHAAACSTCAEILEEERMLDELLGSDMTFEPRPGFFYKAESVVRSDDVARRGFFETVRIYRVSFALAVVLILVVAFGSIEKQLIVDQWNAWNGSITDEIDGTNPYPASLTKKSADEEYPPLDEVSKSDRQLADGDKPAVDEDEEKEEDTPKADPSEPGESPRAVGIPLPDPR